MFPPVFVASREIECRLAPPSVGDVVEWPLLFRSTCDVESPFHHRAVEVTGQTWAPAPTAARHVHQSPKWFNLHSPGDRQERGAVRTDTVGVLVTLEPTSDLEAT